VTIDLSGGPFEPGMTPEPDGTSEIEFTLAVPGASTVLIAGGPSADQIVLGVDGVNLNAAESPGDADVVIAGTPAVTIQGNGGNDVISVAGGAGTGAASAAALQGGADDDRLVGAIGGSAFDGGDGVDTVDYTAAPVPVVVILSSSAAVGSATDSLSGLENATASAFGDILMGDGGANALLGQAGDDRIDGGGGNDVLDGGEGTDTLEFGSSSSGVDVQLAKGTSSGAGEDTIAGFENVVGTGSADTIHGDSERNHITGGAGGDDLLGHAGRDIVKSGAGKDLASGQKGGDLIFGGKGKDQLDGGKGDDACRGGPDPDSFVFCEQIRLD
jgi:Ca2+-binding RTX toxin-like protein